MPQFPKENLFTNDSDLSDGKDDPRKKYVLVGKLQFFLCSKKNINRQVDCKKDY